MKNPDLLENAMQFAFAQYVSAQFATLMTSLSSVDASAVPQARAAFASRVAAAETAVEDIMRDVAGDTDRASDEEIYKELPKAPARSPDAGPVVESDDEFRTRILAAAGRTVHPDAYKAIVTASGGDLDTLAKDYTAGGFPIVRGGVPAKAPISQEGYGTGNAQQPTGDALSQGVASSQGKPGEPGDPNAPPVGG